MTCYLPKATIFPTDVIAIDKSILPPRSMVQILDAPPAGETPVKNIPNCISALPGNKINPRA